MRTLFTVAALALCASPSLASANAADAPLVRDLSGTYVEARTASVFAGACHFGAEFTTAGREAVLAWQLEQGSVDGVSLAGVTVIAAVAAEENLDVPEAARSSVVYLAQDLDPARREAVLAWLEAEHAPALGTLRAVRAVDVSLVLADDAYRVRAGEFVSIEGSLLPDRECCRMPQEVWYRPFDRAVSHPIVGQAALFSCTEVVLERTFTLRGANCVFAGRFGDEAHASGA